MLCWIALRRVGGAAPMATVSLPPEGLAAPSPSTPFVSPVEPRRFGRYLLVREVAAGGMGHVFLALERGAAGYERRVALKRIHDHLVREPGFVAMFLDEARIAARIQHPHVCTVYDCGEAEGAYYLAMEYLQGRAMSDLIRELGRLAPERSPERFALGAALMSQACEGLHAAHKLTDTTGRPLHVVHRDISPQNLFVCWDGTVRVLDFGVAHAADKTSDTSGGHVKGKLAYMAPEQACGEPLDHRADVFSMGVVLWELLTLRRLFRRDSPGETVHVLTTTDAPRAGDVVPDVPAALDEIAARALSRDRNGRFADARAMGRALAAAAGQLSPTVGAADVAEWMAKLWPGAAGASEQATEKAVATAYAISVHIEGTPVPESTQLSLVSATDTRVEPKPAVAARGGGARRAAMIAMATIAVAALGTWGWLATASWRAPTTIDPTPRRAVVPEATTLAPPPAFIPPPVAPAPSFVPPPVVRRAAVGAAAPTRARAPHSVAAAPTADPVALRLSGPESVWGAEVFYEGRPIGTVPGTVRVPPGSRTLELRTQDATWRQRVRVAADGASRIVLSAPTPAH